MLDFLAWIIGTVLVLLTVSIHYETILLASDHVVPWTTRHFRGRRAVPIIITALLLGHIAEIWLWAICYMGVLQFAEMGALGTNPHHNFNDYLYFSAVGYSSIGDNGLQPSGPVRALFACETLAGLLMLAWSASYAYLKMEQMWKEHKAV